MLVAALALVLIARTHADDAPVIVLPDRHTTGVVVDSQTERAFVASYNDNQRGGHLVMIDATNGRPVQMMPLSFTPVVMALDIRAERVYIAGPKNTANDVLSIVDARDGVMLRPIVLPANVHSIAMDALHGHVYIGSAGDGETQSSGSVSILNVTSGRRERSLPLGGDPWGLALDARTNHLVVGLYTSDVYGSGEYGTTHILTLDAGSGRVVNDLSLGTVEGRSLVLDAHAGRAFVLTNNLTGAFSSTPTKNKGIVTIIDTVSGALVRQTLLIGQPADMAIDEQTSHIVVADDGPSPVMQTAPSTRARAWWSSRVPSRPATEGRLSVLDARSGRVLRSVHVDGAPVAVALSPTSGFILATRTSLVDASGITFDAGTVSSLDEARGVMHGVAQAPTLPNVGRLAVDDRTGHIFVVSDGGERLVQGPWSWAPSWLRKILPFIPTQRIQTQSFPARITVLGTGR